MLSPEYLQGDFTNSDAHSKCVRFNTKSLSGAKLQKNGSPWLSSKFVLQVWGAPSSAIIRRLDAGQSAGVNAQVATGASFIEQSISRGRNVFCSKHNGFSVTTPSPLPLSVSSTVSELQSLGSTWCSRNPTQTSDTYGMECVSPWMQCESNVVNFWICAEELSSPEWALLPCLGEPKQPNLTCKKSSKAA